MTRKDYKWETRVLRMLQHLQDYYRDKEISPRQAGKFAFGYYSKNANHGRVVALMLQVADSMIAGRDGVLIPKKDGKKIVAWVLRTKPSCDEETRAATEDHLETLNTRAKRAKVRLVSTIVTHEKNKTLPPATINLLTSGE